MRSVRRGRRLLLTLAGPASFEIVAGRDVRNVLPIFEEDQVTGEVLSLHSFQVASVVATARLRPFGSEFLRTWSLSANTQSAYREFFWDVAANDLAALAWPNDDLARTLFVDFVATTNEDGVNYSRALEDADGNFVFPMRVTRGMT